ncbi:MAG TPA: hypothetical protein VH593_12105, partial [Ktedonobacteraceae bacterium]
PENRLFTLKATNTLRNRYRDHSYEYSQFQADCQVGLLKQKRENTLLQREGGGFARVSVVGSDMSCIALLVPIHQLNSQILDTLRK